MPGADPVLVGFAADCAEEGEGQDGPSPFLGFVVEESGISDWVTEDWLPNEYQPVPAALLAR